MRRNERRDAGEVRSFLLQGLWWQRVVPPRPESVRPTLEWALEIASTGQDLPPIGFLADLGHIALGEPEAGAAAPSLTSDDFLLTILPNRLLRSYEDHVLGKLYADWSFQRAGDALRRYKGRDRGRGLSFLFRRFTERSGFEGVGLRPGLIKSLLEASPAEIHSQGYESLNRGGLHADLIQQYEMLIAASQRIAEVLGPEDISQLERGTALKPEGEQLAERQVLRAAHMLEKSLPYHRPRPHRGVTEVPTRILEEDRYPVGGFSSLTTRGSIESMLYSQLAYMEKDERPDLFDIKFLRDELLYYARDENQFLRRRRTFVFLLSPDLDQTRFKDRGLDYQRGVLLLALLYTVVRQLTEWLTTDALTFRFVFLVEKDKDSLQPERDLLATLLMEEIAKGSVILHRESESNISSLCAEWARRSQCQSLVISVRPCSFESSDTTVHRLQIEGSRPLFVEADDAPSVPEESDAMDSWVKVMQEILERWI